MRWAIALACVHARVLIGAQASAAASMRLRAALRLGVCVSMPGVQRAAPCERKAHPHTWFAQASASLQACMLRSEQRAPFDWSQSPKPRASSWVGVSALIEHEEPAPEVQPPGKEGEPLAAPWDTCKS